MKNDRLQHTIDLLKRCGEEKGLVITEEEMAGKAGLSLRELQAYLEGEESAPVGLGARLKAAYGDLIAAIRREGYRNSMLSSIKATRAMGREVGLTITEEDMALKIHLPFAQLQAYINGDQPTPRDMTGLLITAYEDLRKEIQQRSLNGPLRSTMKTIQQMGERRGMEITVEEMAQRIGMTGQELDTYLRDPNKTHEEFSALADRLWAAYPGLLRNVKHVTLTSVKEAKPPLYVELDWDDWEEE